MKLFRLMALAVAGMFLTGVYGADLSCLEKLPRTREKLEAGQPVTVVALGDSITTYFGNHSRNCGYYGVPVQVSYYGVFTGYIKLAVPEAEFKIINKGIGGETADRGLKRVERDVLSQNPDLVFVMYGANDGRGGRDMAQFRKELKEIIGKIRSAGADAVLVAPTMSLSDLSWLLPCRETVLSLRGEVDCPVLDGTMALWPVDEQVGSLEEVHNYLARHFPPNGDDIHPSFSGHVQLGRRLWTQLQKGDPEIPLKFEFLSPQPATGVLLPCTLKIKNISTKPFRGTVQVFFPKEIPVSKVPLITQTLANTATGNRRELVPMELDLAPGTSRTVEWSIELPSSKEIISNSSSTTWLNEKLGIGVAVFSASCNLVDYLEAKLLPVAITVSGPRYVKDANSAKLEIMTKNLTDDQIEGVLEISGKENKPLSLGPSKSASFHTEIPLPSSTRKAINLHIPIFARNQNGSIIGMASGRVEAMPCVNAKELPARIDGNISEWNDDEWHVFDAGKSEARFTARYFNDTLLLAFQAKDAVLSFQHRRIWQSDGFELYLDPRDEKELGTPGSPFQLGFFPPKDQSKSLLVVPGTGAEGANLNKVETAWRKTGDGYQLEAAIPRELFSGKSIENGRILGFGVACNDVTRTEEIRTQYQWSGTKRNYATPVAYGLLRFGNGPPVWRINYSQ